MKKFHMIGNTHFDPVWLWKWDEAMASIRATFRSALDRMKEDEGFIYSFATPPVFEWIKRTDPEMFREIKERIAEGRWELAEGWWLQPDCYSANGESYIRQGIYGQRYLKENFGKMSNTVFSADSFGHSPQLPQILRKSGVRYYCFARPEKWHIELTKPYFKWEGIDGSTVLAYRIETAWQPDVNDTAQKLEYLDGDHQLIVYGVTDHGGAPTKKAIADINEAENMEFSTFSNFFETEGDTDYVVSKELLTGDFGPYSNGVDIKRLNLLAENAVLNAEKSAVISGRYEREVLTGCWKDIMFNQFHDILGGATIKEACQDARNLYGRAISTAEYIMHTNLQLVTSQIKMPGKNPDHVWNLVVWNLNGADYNGYMEAEVQWVHEFPWYDKSITLEDSEGNSYECQIIRERSVIPGFRSRFVWKAGVPAMGYKTFKVIKSEKDVKIVSDENPDPYRIETTLFEFVISKENGSLEKAVNKKTGQIMDSPLFVPDCYADDGDTWAFNVEGYGEWLGTFQVTKIQVIENGIHRTKIKVTSRYRDSILSTYYTFYEKESYVDIEYKVHWNEKHTVFKFDMNMKRHGIKVGIPAGSVMREDAKGDVPMSRWIQFGGITLLSDSIFAYYSDEQKVGLTVLRSPIYGDLRIEEIDLDADYAIMQQGMTEGRIRIYFDESIDAEKEAELYANECIVIDEANHDGIYDSVGSYLNVIAEGVSVMALKPCEDDDGIIVRLREYMGQKEEAKLIFDNKTYTIDMSEHEIKTLKIKNEIIKEVNMLEMQ